MRYIRWGCRRWTRQRAAVQWLPLCVGDDEPVGGAGDGDPASVVQPMMVGAEQDQVVQFGGPAIFPVPNMVRMQAPGRSATGNHAAAVAVFQSAAQPAADLAGAASGADGLAVALKPEFVGGVTQQ